MFINQILTKLKSLVYSKSETDSLLNGKASSSHTHTKSQITDFPTIPSKTSQLTNDSGFLTSHQSLANYVTLNSDQTIPGYKIFSGLTKTSGKVGYDTSGNDVNNAIYNMETTAWGPETANKPESDYGTLLSLNREVNVHTSAGVGWIVQFGISTDTRLYLRTKTNIGGAWSSWKEFSDISHTHTKSQITDFPTIPTNTNQLTNGAGFITSSGSCNYANSAGYASSAGSAGEVNTSVAAGSTKNLVYASMSNNDQCRIMCGGADNAGYMEIATSDDGNEPIYVRQYNNGTFGSIVRTLTLLDENGNTQFPGTVTAPTFSGNLNGNCDYATSAGSCNYANSAGSSSIATRDSGGTWISGRDNAVVKQTRHSTDDGNSWNPAVSVKTKSGNWTIGTVGYDKLQFSYDTDEDYNTGNNRNTVVELNPESGTIITSANIGSQSVNYANSAGSAGSVAWGNVSGRPWAVSQFSNDSGYITTDGAAYPRRVGGVTMNFNWNGQGGQPTWLWGGEDGTNMYVYNPANFSVNYANSAGYTNWLRTSSHSDHLFHTEWDGSYFWTYVTAGDGGYRAVRVERSNSSGYADSAGGVAWGNVSGRPWAVSQFTNDSGFITSEIDSQSLGDSGWIRFKNGLQICWEFGIQRNSLGTLYSWNKAFSAVFVAIASDVGPADDNASQHLSDAVCIRPYSATQYRLGGYIAVLPDKTNFYIQYIAIGKWK